ASSIPVVSGVGHEVDVTICDLVADVRAATPTAAAEAVVPKETDLRAQLAQAKDRLRRLLSARLEHAEALVGGLARSVRPETLLRHIESREQRLDDLYTIARNHLRGRVALEDRRLDGLFGKVKSLDPLAVLARGYSVTMDERSGTILRDASKAKTGQRIVTRLHKGELASEVTAVKKDDKP
ncbi:MAG: exodeoxyribonuclease VII large subunit, partial [Planctomycetota bacterium]